MPNDSQSADRMGWETIWRSGNIPERYQSMAAPDATVAEWAETLPPGEFVLDLGCGAGRHCVYLGGRGFRVTGLDISPTGIQLTQAACAERQITFEERVSDMNTIPWPDGTFDAVLSIATIHHHLRAGIIQAIQEVWRVLKPGGLFLVDFPPTDRSDYQRLRDLAAAGEILEVEPNTFVDQRPDGEDLDGYLPHHYSDEADARDLLGSFEITKLWSTLRSPNQNQGSVQRGKWVAWARKTASN